MICFLRKRKRSENSVIKFKETKHRRHRLMWSLWIRPYLITIMEVNDKSNQRELCEADWNYIKPVFRKLIYFMSFMIKLLSHQATSALENK